MVFSNAGQNFPYVLRAPKEPGGLPAMETLVARGDTLGTAPRVKFDIHRKELHPGDRLIIYTDGVVDAGTPYKEPYGDKRLRAALMGMSAERSTKMPELILAELEKHIAGSPMGDDVTMLVFELHEGAG